MGREWVIDAFVLHKACDDSDATVYLLSVALLLSIGRKDDQKIAIDFQEEIYKEYLPCIRVDRLLQKWWKHLKDRAGKISYYDGKLDARHKIKLVDELGFDRSDIPYIAVAGATSDKVIVSEDSDYTPLVQTYLRDQLGITVIAIGRAIT